MSFTPDRLEDGDAFGALDALLLDAQTAVNGLVRNDVRDASVTADTLSTTVVDPQVEDTVRRERTNGFTYNEATHDVTYAGYGQSGDREPFRLTTAGDPADADVDISWDPDGSQYPQLLILANAVLVSVTNKDTVSDPVDNTYAMLCIQVYQGGAWRTVRLSERIASTFDRDSGGGVGPIDVPIRLLLNSTLLTTLGLSGTLTISGVRLATSIINGTGSSNITWDDWNLSVIPLRG